MGSRIIDAQGNELWPGGIGKLLFSSYGDLALDIDPQTLAVDTRGETASGITDQIAGRAFYASIIKTLQDVAGYQLTQPGHKPEPGKRSEEHTSELQSLLRISYAVFCLKKKK